MIKERTINRKITKWDLNESQTLKISTLNIRSLKKHFIDLREDDFLQKSDIICVNETWLVSDPDENLNGFHGHFINLKSQGTSVYCKIEANKVQKIASENASIIFDICVQIFWRFRFRSFYKRSLRTFEFEEKCYSSWRYEY